MAWRNLLSRAQTALSSAQLVFGVRSGHETAQILLRAARFQRRRSSGARRADPARHRVAATFWIVPCRELRDLAGKDLRRALASRTHPEHRPGEAQWARHGRILGAYRPYHAG